MDVLEFNQEFSQIERRLMSFALKLTNNLEDAKDLVQETGCRAYRHKESFQTGSNFRAWLTIIMRNTFINDYRKRKRHNLWFEPISNQHSSKLTIDNTAESNLTMQELSCHLTRVDEIFRTPFLLHYEGFKYDEIAEKLGIPLGTVKSRIFFARKKMRQSIERVHY